VATDDFGAAIYTNCAPGEGLEAVGGMQFQSSSAGVDRKTLALIRRHLIYEPPERLIQEEQPVEEFPPSFAHVHDRVFATAAGVYTGREADGPRQGNHLTHAIVTEDPRAYRAFRPAQLFHAPFWRTEPAPSTHSERLSPPLPPGPFGAEQASQFVRDQRGGVDLLAAILLALRAHVSHDGDGPPRRVLFISEDHEVVMHWLTAATLLIPQDEAVRIGFKVFTTDPARSTLPVVAIHPAWTRSAATVQQDRGYTVFDLVRHEWTARPASAEALHWARLFCEADPLDVSEAVELAGASGLTEPGGRQLVATAVFGRPPEPASTGVLVRWLRTGPPALREAYGGRLITALAKLPDLDLSLLREMDTAADEQFPGRRDQMRLNLLRVELRNALYNPMRVQPRTPRRAVSPAIEPEAARLVTEALRKAQGAAFDAVLNVSGRFEISVPLDAVHAATVAFVAFWADHPDTTYDPTGWPPAPPVLSMLRDELSARLRDQPEIADAWWNRLPGWTPDRPDLALPLERALLSATIKNGDQRTRLRVIRSILSRPTENSLRGPYRWLADILWKRSKPTIEELRELHRLVPDGTEFSPAIFAGVLARAAADPTGLVELALCAELEQHRLLELAPGTVQLLEQNDWLEAFERNPGQRSDNFTEDQYLLQLPPPLLSAHAQPLARTLLTLDDPVRAQYLLYGLPIRVVIAYLYTVRNDSQSFGPRLVAAVCAADVRAAKEVPQGDPSHQVGEYINAMVADWCRGASRRKVRKVSHYIGAFDKGLAADWDAFAAHLRRGRWRRWHLVTRSLR
jgi:hypothetical protein